MNYTGTVIPAGDISISLGNINRIPNGSMSGAITVTSKGTVEVRDTMGYDDAGVWHEDRGPGIDVQNVSDADLVATRDVGIRVWAGNGQEFYGQIGHGGNSWRANSTGATGFSR